MDGCDVDDRNLRADANDAKRPNQDADDDDESASADVDAALDGLKAQSTRKKVKKLNAKKKKLSKKNKPGAKTSAGSKTEISSSANPSKGLLECLTFETRIETKTQPPTSREKHCLDDYLLSLAFARNDLANPITEEESSRAKRFLVSMFLELAWNGSVSVSGKIFSVYSTFRDESQKIFRAAHQKLTLGSQAYDPLKLASDLLTIVGEKARVRVKLAVM